MLIRENFTEEFSDAQTTLRVGDEIISHIFSIFGFW